MSERYFKFNLYFEKIKLSLNISNFGLEFKDLENYKNDGTIKKIQSQLTKIEAGDSVNISSSLAVDHYNWRMEKEIVPGKSLEKSIQLWKEIKEKIAKIISKKQFTDVVFNGIGGSFLGPVMMIIMDKGPEYFYKTNGLRLHFLSNTDPDSFFELVSGLNLEKTILVTMSKSGGTQETMTNYGVFNELIKKKLKINDIGKFNVCITTKNSKLDKIASENHFTGCFHMDKCTGGRTSVGSAIGMVPAAFAGINFEEFIKGESDMDKLTRDFSTMTCNPALLIALGIDKLTKKTNKNMVILGYSDFLKEYAHYLQQLYMESLGKEFNLKNETVYEGQTVFGGVGTVQQIQKGVFDCFVKFVYFLKRNHDYSHEKCGSMGRQLLAFFKGTEHALSRNKKPFLSLTFERRNLYNLGLMVALEERIVTFLAIIKNINAYDQPGVELGKSSAESMISLLKEMEDIVRKKMSTTEKWEWDCETIKKEYSLDYPIYYIDAGLSDLFANVGIENSYPKLYKMVRIKRNFKNQRFLYLFEKF